MSNRPEIAAAAHGWPCDAEFRISDDPAAFPVTPCPTYLKTGIGGVCRSGHITIQVLETRFRITPGMIVTLLPWQLASVREVSDDFRITYFTLSQPFFMDILSGLWRLRPGFFFYMSRHIASEPDERNIDRFLAYCDLLTHWYGQASPTCRRETLVQFLRIYYWTVFMVYIDDPLAQKTRYSHKEELAFRFIQHIVEEHSPDRDVAFYARKLGISPKSLTNLVRSLSGQSARDWIVYYTLIEIKSLLRDSALDIKSIAARTRFPDPATMSRFFRRYTGMSPSEYRESFFF
ncbi:helix-turn-helix domain-containing protein [Alistipes sp.]|uniref:AraC family transcriptional regulator n=1 Tax=Alistipes sp. TaxID=1872444 RepID=UPI003AEF24C7